MIQTKRGDLILLTKKGQFDVIIHGCNCFCTMGAGIAKQIKLNWPKAYEVDKKTKYADRSKLGTYSKAEIILQVPDGSGYKNQDLTIINAYTQYDYRGSGQLVSLDAVEKIFSQLNKEYVGKRVGMPKIGAGLARGNWDEILSIIQSTTPNLNITVVEYGI